GAAGSYGLHDRPASRARDVRLLAGFNRQECLPTHGAGEPMIPLLTLSFIAHGRSGDKGNHANIAVIAYTKAGYDWLRANLSPEAVLEDFKSLQPSRVVRYEAGNLLGLDFVVSDVFAGRATRT